MKKSRRLSALLSALLILCTLVLPAGAKTAADYADGAEITYVQAVDVLSGLEILQGSGDSFRPLDTIQRQEAAKMAAMLHGGGPVPPTEAPCAFADVRGRWSEPYVAYCAAKGIIAGRSETEFDPTGAVTGAELLKMLLGVLGYDARECGYVGPEWAEAVLGDGERLGLTAELEPFRPREPATRQEAAQLFLNTLSLKPADGTEALWTRFAGLTREESTRDAWGRPAVSWTLLAPEGTERFHRVYPRQPDRVILEKDSLNGLKAKLRGMEDPEIAVFLDGAAAGDTLAAAAAATGKGVRLEIYEKENGADLVLCSTYFDEVLSVDEQAGTFTLHGGTYPNDRSLKPGQMILYGKCGSRLQNVRQARAVRVEVTGSSQAAADKYWPGRHWYDNLEHAWFRAGTEVYTYARMFNNSIWEQNLTVLGPQNSLPGSNCYDLWLDDYGYVMYFRQVKEGKTG